MDFQFLFYLKYDFLVPNKDGKRIHGTDEILLNSKTTKEAIEAANELVRELRLMGVTVTNPVVIARFESPALN